MEAVNTRAVGQTKLRVAKNDRTIVWSFKRGHYRKVHGGQDQEEKILISTVWSHNQCVDRYITGIACDIRYKSEYKIMTYSRLQNLGHGLFFFPFWVRF